MTPSIVEAAEALARQWERDGHPLTNPEIAPVILFDPAARETVLLAVEYLNAETAHSFLHALADCPPLADFGLQALSRRADATREALEQVLGHFPTFADSDYWKIPEQGLNALTTAKNPSLTTWATDFLFAKWASVKLKSAWQAHVVMLGKLFTNETMDSLFARWDSVKGDYAAYQYAAIAKALGAIGDSRAIDFLLDRWDSVMEDNAVRQYEAIASALGDIGDSRAIDFLLDKWNRVKGEGVSDIDLIIIAFEIGRLFVHESIDSLFVRWESIKSDEEDAWAMQSGIALALRDIGDSRAIDFLLEKWDVVPPGSNAHPAMVTTIGELFMNENVEFLLAKWETFKKEDTFLQKSIAKTLGQLLVNESIESLLARWETAKEEDTWLVYQAIVIALGAIGDNRAIDFLLEKWDTVPKNNAWGEYEIGQFYETIAIALGAIGDRRAIDFLLEKWNAIPEFGARFVRETIAEVLAKLFVNESIESLFSRWDRVGDYAANEYVAIASALGDIGDNRAIDFLLDKLTGLMPVFSRHVYIAFGRSLIMALEKLFINEPMDSLIVRWDSLKGESASETHYAITRGLTLKGAPAVPFVWSIWRNPEEPEETRQHMACVLFTLGTFSPEAKLGHR